MIPDLRAFDVRVRRRFAAHQVLRDFCTTLYSCRSELDDTASSDDWRRFIRPIWRFHNLAVAVPLPLNHHALLSVETAQEIEREAGRVRNRIPGVRALVDRVCDSLSACRRSCIDPLGDLLRLALESSSTQAVLVPYDDDHVLSAIREAGAIPHAASLLSQRQQREHRDRLRRGLPMVVLGKLANIDPVLLRAPLGDCTLDVLLYAWAGDKRASEIAGPLLSELLPGTSRAPGFACFGDDDRPAQGASSVGSHQGAELQEDAVLEDRPFVLPHIDLLGMARASQPDSEEQSETTRAVVLVLADEGLRRAATMLELDDPVLVLRCSREGWSPVEVRAGDVLKGDLYVEKADPADHDVIERMARESLSRDGHLERLQALQHQWKNLLAERLKREGIAEVTRAVSAHCDGWQPGEDRIFEWIRSDTIGPQQKQAFRAVCRFLAISDVQAKEHWRAMRAIHNARIAAGKDLSQRLLDRVIVECRDGGFSVDAPTRISIGERVTTAYPIEFVSPRMTIVPRSSLGFVFSISGVDPDQWAEAPSA